MSASTPGFRASILRMVASAFPSIAYSYPRTYVVAAVDGEGRLDLVPPPDAAHLPELPAVEQWTIGGAAVTPAVGSQVTVVFRDADRRRPVVVTFAEVPTTLDLAGGGPAVARVGDAVDSGALYVQLTAGVFTALWWRAPLTVVWTVIASGALNPPVGLVGTNLASLVASGSGKVNSG